MIASASTMQFKRRPSRRFLFWAVALEAAWQGLRESAPMELLLMAAASLLAGFVDAIVGGCGLILVPALFAILPNAHPATLFGISKSASIWGTGLATVLHASAAAKLVNTFTRLALRHGAGFVRGVFILVVTALILKTGYDAFVR